MALVSYVRSSVLRLDVAYTAGVYRLLYFPRLFGRLMLMLKLLNKEGGENAKERTQINMSCTRY